MKSQPVAGAANLLARNGYFAVNPHRIAVGVDIQNIIFGLESFKQPADFFTHIKSILSRRLGKRSDNLYDWFALLEPISGCLHLRLSCARKLHH